MRRRHKTVVATIRLLPTRCAGFPARCANTAARGVGIAAIGALLAAGCGGGNDAAPPASTRTVATDNVTIEGTPDIEVERLDVPDNVEVTIDRVYAANRTLDVYRSTDPGPHPLVVVFPGRSSDKALYSTFGARLAGAGAVVLVPNYRARDTPEAALQDAHCVIDAAIDRAEELGGDPQRLIVAGFTWGAIPAFGEGLSGSWQAGADGADCGAPAGSAEIAGVVGIVGQYSFFSDLEPTGDEYLAYSPYAQVTAEPGPKIRLLHGVPDRLTISNVETEKYAAALRDAGHDVTVTEFDEPNLSLAGLIYDEDASALRLIDDPNALGAVDAAVAAVLAVLDVP